MVTASGSTTSSRSSWLGTTFDHQLALELLAIAATFGWEKALGSSAELDWWAERALRGARLLDRQEPGWR